MKIFNKIILSIIGALLSIMLLIVLFFGHRDIPLEKLKAEYAPAPSFFLALDGMEVHVRDEGIANDPVPIVLIHGTGSSLHTFDVWTGGLGEKRRVIRMDLPGYGLTGPFPDGNYAMDHYVEFMLHLLDKLDVEQCVLAGNSLGGAIAWRFTLAYPDRVNKLVLIDAAGYPSEAKSVPIAFKLAKLPVLNKIATFITPRFLARSSLENVYADDAKINKALVDRYFELTLRKGNRQAYLDRLGVTRDTIVYEQIKTIQQPTLILWGDQDNLIPVSNAYRFHEDLPNDTLMILENSGHVPMEENPEQSLETLKGFLKIKC
jgi:pimeloyl-ACP methyl ester carboxylesterase